MSYILDALKKAERDRGLARVPTVTTVHEFKPRTRGLSWIIAAFLVLAGVISALLFWPASQETPDASDKVQAVPPAETGVESPPKPEELPQPRCEVLPQPKESIAEKKADKPVPAPPVTQTAVAETELPPPPPPQPVANADAPVASLEEAVRKMRMTILMYSDAPSERMVFINGKKYVEGDHVEGRYLLENITMDGAVLSYQGEQVILSPPSD